MLGQQPLMTAVTQRELKVTCRGRECARILASSEISLMEGSPSLRPLPGISTGHTWTLGGSIIAHLQTKLSSTLASHRVSMNNAHHRQILHDGLVAEHHSNDWNLATASQFVLRGSGSCVREACAHLAKTFSETPPA